MNSDENDVTTLSNRKKAGLSYPTLVLAMVIASVLLVNYVETMVIPGVVVIQKYFSTTETIASWITSSFLIVGAAVAPLFGRLGDVYGKRKMFLVVLGFYVVGVGISGFSDSIYTLLFARAIQGVGFAVLPLGIAMVTDVYPKHRVATAQGVISGMVAIGTILGLVVGAYIVQDLGWQYAFHTAFILSIVLIIVVAMVLKKDTLGQKAKMDYAGTALLMAGITLVLMYLTEGPSLGWTTLENFAFLIPGLILIIFFFVFENGRKNPLIELKLLRIRNVFLANMVGIVSGIVMFLAFFAVVYYAQLPAPYGLGLDTISTGLALAPAALVMMAVGPIVGRIMPKVGPKPVILFGSVVIMVGFCMFILNRSTSLDLTIDSAVSFIGVIALIIPIVNMITVSIPQDSTSVGLGMNSMLRNLGGAIGPVLATTIMTSFTVAVIANMGGQPMVVGTLPSSTAFDTIFEVGVVLMMAVFIMGLFINNYVFEKAEQ